MTAIDSFGRSTWKEAEMDRVRPRCFSRIFSISKTLKSLNKRRISRLIRDLMTLLHSDGSEVELRGSLRKKRQAPNGPVGPSQVLDALKPRHRSRCRPVLMYLIHLYNLPRIIHFREIRAFFNVGGETKKARKPLSHPYTNETNKKASMR